MPLPIVDDLGPCRSRASESLLAALDVAIAAAGGFSTAQAAVAARLYVHRAPAAVLGL